MNMIALLDRFLCLAGLALLMTPLLVFVGLKESFVTLAGVEKIVDVPVLDLHSLGDKSFQKGFEENFAKTYFLRKTFLKTRNQICEWVNLGFFHESAGKDILEGKDDVLFSNAYVRYHLDSHNVCSIRGSKAVKVLNSLAAKLAKRKIDFVFVLAPDKINIYPEELPTWLNMIGELKSLNTQSELASVLQGQGIPTFDATAFLRIEKDRYVERLFPVAGVHWNALASGLVLEKLLKDFNESGSVYLINPFLGVKKSDVVRNADDDLGRLLNLWYCDSLKKNIAYVPEYGNHRMPSNPGTLLLLGDSFVWQISRAAAASNTFPVKSQKVYDKRTPPKEELAAVSPNLKMVVLVFNPPNAWALLNKNVRLPMIEALMAL